MNTLPKPQASNALSVRLISAPDVAELFGVPLSTVYELARQKRIGGIVRFGRHIRFDREALERWLEAGGEGGKI